jgi:hypothetical protein
MIRYIFNFLLLCAPAILISSCEQSEPEEMLARVGDVVEFSGYTWDVKHGDYLMGPGPNYFSGFYRDVFVDDRGYLHLRIAEHDGIWYSSEVVGRDTLGYGTYSWTVEGDLVNIPNNIVLGLFTWSNYSFQTQANSEVDIEFAKWLNDDAGTMHYSVQPVNFGPFYPERTHEAEANENALIGVSTHTFKWTDTLITWVSYAGAEMDPSKEIASWQFDLNNPPRIKYENGLASNPIVIPAPDNKTNARMNFWILPVNTVMPADGEEHEIVIQKFSYTPL